eukprot:s3021_g4.t1
MNGSDQKQKMWVFLDMRTDTQEGNLDMKTVNDARLSKLRISEGEQLALLPWFPNHALLVLKYTVHRDERRRRVSKEVIAPPGLENQPLAPQAMPVPAFLGSGPGPGRRSPAAVPPPGLVMGGGHRSRKEEFLPSGWGDEQDPLLRFGNYGGVGAGGGLGGPGYQSQSQAAMLSALSALQQQELILKPRPLMRPQTMLEDAGSLRASEQELAAFLQSQSAFSSSSGLPPGAGPSGLTDPTMGAAWPGFEALHTKQIDELTTEQKQLEDERSKTEAMTKALEDSAKEAKEKGSQHSKLQKKFTQLEGLDELKAAELRMARAHLEHRHQAVQTQDTGLSQEALKEEVKELKAELKELKERYSQQEQLLEQTNQRNADLGTSEQGRGDSQENDEA